jgi:hypothetical protein
MKQSESIAKLAVALVKAQGDMKSIVKDSTNPAFKSSYASLEATVDTVRPILAKYGLCTLQGESAPETDEGKLTGFNVETIVLHESGEWISTAVFVPVEKPSAQGAVSALTYGRRAGLRAVFTLADTDDDGETAQNHAPRAATRPVSSTPTASASPRPAATPTGGAVMPFGKTKGTPLALLKDEEIESALKWAKEKGKFVEFQADAEAELASRVGAGVGAGAADEDDLPFN